MTSSHSNPHHTGDPQLAYDKTSAKQMIIKPGDLNIVWGGDDRYWNTSGNEDMAELYQVCWLEVTGCVKQINPQRDYDVGFEVSLAPNAFGWSGTPLYLMVKRGKDGKSAWKKLQVNPDETNRFKIYMNSAGSKNYADQSSTEDNNIYFGLYEVWSGKWKGGLRIHNAYVTEV